MVNGDGVLCMVESQEKGSRRVMLCNEAGVSVHESDPGVVKSAWKHNATRRQKSHSNLLLVQNTARCILVFGFYAHRVALGISVIFKMMSMVCFGTSDVHCPVPA